jgi:4-amino-4-deoxy-L-arabinose transferase-like glycosyltransferase
MLESPSATFPSAQDRPAAPEALMPDSPPHVGLLLVVLMAFALVTCLGGLGSGPALGDHECINAQAARQVLQSGQWLIPQLGEIPRVRKMPLGIWLIAGSSRLVDNPTTGPLVTELSARLPSALAGLLTTLVVYWLGGMMFGKRTGLVAGFLWAGSAAAILFTRNALVDMVLTLFTTLSFAFFWRGAVHTPRSKPAMFAFYVAFALAMMAKAPLPLISVGMALALFWLVALPLVSASEESPADWQAFRGCVHKHMWKRLKAVPSLAILPGTLLWLVLIAAWPLYVLSHCGVKAGLLWKLEYFDMATGGGMDRHPQPFGYYIPIIFAFMGAYALSVPEGLAAPFLRRYRRQRAGLALAFTWGVWGWFALSMITTKRWHYPLSIMPAFCLLLAPVIDRLFFALAAPGADRRVRLTCRVLPFALAAAAVTIGVFLYRGYASLLPAYAAIAIILLALLTAAARSFASGRRTLSFGLLNLTVAVVACLAWPIAGQHLQANPDADELVAKLKAAGITRDDPLYIVDSRPDSSIEFYHGYRPERLVDELEMAKLRPNRKEVSAGLLKLMAQNLEKKLREPQPVYLLMKYDNYLRFKQFSHVPFRLVLSVYTGGKGNDPRQVVITQTATATQFLDGRTTQGQETPSHPITPFVSADRPWHQPASARSRGS